MVIGMSIELSARILGKTSQISVKNCVPKEPNAQDRASESRLRDR